MRVSVSCTIEIDPSRYREVTGEHWLTGPEIRAYVKNDSRDAIEQHFSDYGARVTAKD